jgi:hypothetical protein
MSEPSKPVLGITELVSIGRNTINVPAKIDTGADRSTIWASGIRVSKDGVLKFKLFDKKSKYYTGRVFRRTDFGIAKVKSSNGQTELRYRTHFTLKIAGKRIKTLFYLADRSGQKFPILIGRKTVNRKFLINVSQGTSRLQKTKNVGLNDELRQNPYKFHKKYIKTANKEGAK